MKKIYFVLFAILCTIIFACTDNLISTDLISNQNSSTGELKVFVKQSRLYSPVISEISWTVELVDEEKNTYSSKENENYFLFSNLKLGTYTVNASGKDSLGVERFFGSITINFDSTEPLEVFVPVSASKNSSDTTSTGFATITMEMSEELLEILSTMEVVFLQANLLSPDIAVFSNLAKTTYTDNQEIESIDIFDNQTINFVYILPDDKTETSDIPVGYYNLSFLGLGDYGYSIKLKDNLVEIGAGLTTNIVLTENDYQLVKNYETYVFVDNSENSNDETSEEKFYGKTLSKPIGFSKLSSDELVGSNLIYLLSDVEFSNGVETRISPMFENFSGTISSFGSTIRTISANISDYYDSITLGNGTTLKNIKLSGTNEFTFESLILDETVILDCKMGADSLCVQLSKTSNLQIGENFSGDLYLSLSQENWKVGDTVINFENGKPENSNFYIEENCCNSEFQNYSSMFYIDESGKLAKYTDDFTSFAWSVSTPYLVTKTQAKNNTCITLYTNHVSDDTVLYGYTGVSTYDGDKTWYFVCNNSENQRYSLYSVTTPDNYSNTLIVDVVEFPIQETHEGISLERIQYMTYDDGKLYFLSQADCYQIDYYDITSGALGMYNVEIKLSDDTYPRPTAFFVKGNDFYFATTYTDNNQASNSSITHSAIWKCVLTENANGGYSLSHSQTYKGNDGADYPVPYYLTHSDIELTVNGSLPSEPSNNAYVPAFRITDLYSDGTSVYGLLANYIETNENNANGNVYMRGSVFKLVENTTTVNVFHYGLRNSLSISDIPTAKQYFILPRKIVGIINKKLIIADDGMIPDKTDCNLDRFILFDLDGSISEKIDVDVSFTTSGSTSGFATNFLF